MSENETTEKKTVTRIEPVVFHNENDVVTYIGNGRGADTKYGIVFPIPQNDDEAKDRYNCSLNDLVRMGVQKITTAPAYGPVMFESRVNEEGKTVYDGALLEGGHEAGQALADEYRIGARKASDGMTAAQAKKRAKASEAVAIEMAGRCGLSPEEVMAMIAAAQAA